MFSSHEALLAHGADHDAPHRAPGYFQARKGCSIADVPQATLLCLRTALVLAISHPRALEALLDIDVEIGVRQANLVGRACGVQ